LLARNDQNEWNQTTNTFQKRAIKEMITVISQLIDNKL